MMGKWGQLSLNTCIHSDCIVVFYRFITLILPSIPNIEFPPDPVKRKEMFGLQNHPGARATLLDFMLTILKMPYRLVECLITIQ